MNFEDKIRFDLQNNNFYFNTSYKGYLNDNLQIFSGFSYGYTQNKIEISADKISNNERLEDLLDEVLQNTDQVRKLSVEVEHE